MTNQLTQNFKDIMSRWPTGVSVITTIDAAGVKYGFTANSFTSVSLDPMLVSFCLMQTSATLSKLEKSKKFIVSILSHNQENIAKHFATPIPDKFQNIAHKLCSKTGCPYLEDILGYMKCETRFQYPGGDHDIFIGEVIEIFIDKEKKPLVYFDRKFSG
jgi:flavin reductase (DIM6/NTAB) family NADH-FMN oxidoreductase RutF